MKKLGPLNSQVLKEELVKAQSLRMFMNQYVLFQIVTGVIFIRVLMMVGMY